MLETLKEKRGQGGFTLIELLIVVIILAILAAIVVFAVGSTSTNAKVSACNADAKSVETALEAYKAQMGSYPPNLNSLTSAVTNNNVVTGPWLRAIPSAGTSANGYSIGLTSANNASAGEVDVQTNGAAAGQAGWTDYDGSSVCSGAH